MTDSVNDWIVNCIGFGEQRTPDGEKRTDLHEIEYSSGIDDQIRCPSHEPQRDCHKGDLCQFTLGALILIFRRSQGSDVHLLRLFSHIFLVSSDRLDDEPVTPNDEEQRQEVHPYAVHDEIRHGHYIPAEVIGAARGHVTFWYISVPAKHRRDCPY